MRLSWHPSFQSQFNSSQNSAFVVVQNQRQDVDHRAISAFFAQHVILQSTEDVGHLCKRRTIAKGPRFALDDRQIVAPIIDDPAWLAVGPINDP